MYIDLKKKGPFQVQNVFSETKVQIQLIHGYLHSLPGHTAVMQ